MPTRLLIHTRHRHGDSPSGTNTPQQRAHPVIADAAAGAPAAEMGWSPETARGKRGLITTRRRGTRTRPGWQQRPWSGERFSSVLTFLSFK